MDEPAEDPKPAFHAAFTAAISSLSSAISSLPSLGHSAQQDAISSSLSKISELTVQLKDAAGFLPAYEMRVYSEQLKGVSDSLSTSRKAVAPRAKFSFKNRRSGPSSTPTSTSTPKPPAPVPTPPLPKPPPSTTGILSLSSLTNRTILPQTTEESFTTASITTIASSLIFAAVEGPVHITDVKSSILVISCRQFRLHDCNNVDVYLRCSSRPIIERCSNIRVSPLSSYLKGVLGVDGDGEDRWDQIDDFNWLKEGRASPNWRVLKEEERIGEERWRGVLEGGDIESLLP
ncbi:hypothetical protein TWF481_012136 [Arthrobotrys musiformis]|uniref:C-CAP/cofactor C-like domain-containing protein n=1 Tax=Arthrobotrys musiformis TaxID=47236 RepID=A0AAV9VY40_9PEZI